MAQLGKLWAGHVYGTNTGNLFVSFEQDGPTLLGTLKLLDDRFGLVEYIVKGTYGKDVSLNGTPSRAPEGVTCGDLSIRATLTSEGTLRGEWNTSIGTQGTFQLFPHTGSQLPRQSSLAGIPEQFFVHNIKLQALTVFDSDIQNLISLLTTDFQMGRVIVTYNDGGPDVTKFADAFLNDVAKPEQLKYLKLFIQEPDAHGINKFIMIEMSAFGSNEIRVQGVRKSWVVGSAETLASSLKKNANHLATGVKKFGLNLNTLILLATLVAIPEIPSLLFRAAFVLCVVLLLQGVHWFHSQFIPNASINLFPPKAPLFERLKPTLISWVVAVTATVAASWIFVWLQSQ